MLKWLNIRNPITNDDPLYVRVLQDQLFDVRRGTFVSMPINSMLSCLILFAQITSGNILYASIWFCIVNLINFIRLLQSIHLTSYDYYVYRYDAEWLNKYLFRYKYWAFFSGVAWAFVAFLTDGYQTDHYALYLIIVAGICAGAVTSISSSVWIPFNFIIPPLLVAAICLSYQASMHDYILVFAIGLFIIGLVRGAVLGQQRFVEASRRKHEATDVAQAMERMSKEDPLTGLLNRRGMEGAVEHLKDSQTSFIVMLIDLDGFKAVNDTYGHKKGDDLLVIIARRLRQCAPKNAIIARIGGDEFAVLYPDTNNTLKPQLIAQHIIRTLIQPYTAAGSVQIGACIGICRSCLSNLSAMLLSADIALYEAKDMGRNELYIFDHILQEKLARRQAIEKDLEQALDANEITNWFQPIIDLTTFKVAGFEALLRWKHQVYGNIPAPEIVQIARDVGMLENLTHHVFQNCCDMLVRLREAGRSDVIVAMNLSSRELASANIEMMIVNGFKKYQIPFSSFEIEITEDAPINHFTVEDTLTRLSGRGISIAIDDFGTGFSTLASLKSGMINKVKIDKSFIAKVAFSKEDQLLVKAVVDLGLAMKLEVVIEGVESAKNLEVLTSLGCCKAQGYLFSPAIMPDDAIEYALMQPERQPAAS